MVQLNTLMGIVNDIGMRASTVRTFDGSEVIVPNGDLVGAQLINWTLSDRRRRMTIEVDVAYGTEATTVLGVLLGVAGEHEEVLSDPEPESLFTGFGESALNFQLRAWTESPRGAPIVKSELTVAIQAALADAGIVVPFPQRDLHVRNAPEIGQALADSLGRS
ncbi:MAG: mechanosensitive ion channel family protein [Planctomycetota bacterium]|jgi:small-conductance mechanosensitive channel